ncbi:putative membrane protein YeiH [Clostridiaceae bacterium JG1575]|nr:putative membrane protein YeiH [Clostridiaceae bacterium JG1575]
MNSSRIFTKKNLAILVCLFIAIVATYLSKQQRWIGGPMIGLLIGMILVNLMPALDKEFKSGTSWAGKKFLSAGIVLAGATLNFNTVLGYGAKAIPLVLFNMALAFGVALFVGKRLGLSKNTSLLVGGGTSICGGTAIATVASIIKAHEDEIAYALTAIFLFDLFAALSYPYFAKAIGMTPAQFGFFAGTSINDTSSVAAAQDTFSKLMGLSIHHPITVKLTRTTMLIPLAILLSALQGAKARKDASIEKTSVGKTVLKIFPWFILLFLIAALINTFGWIPKDYAKLISTAYKFFITAALAGVGFKIKFHDLFTKGLKPILLGGITWLFVFLSSFTMINLFSAYFQ